MAGGFQLTDSALDFLWQIPCRGLPKQSSLRTADTSPVGPTYASAASRTSRGGWPPPPPGP